MRTILKKSNFGVLMMAAIMCSGLGYQAYALRRAPKSPVTVATVNLPKVMDGLDQWSISRAELQQMFESIREEVDVRDDERRSIGEQLESLDSQATPDEQKRKELEQKLADLTVKTVAWTRFNADKMDIEESVQLRDLYRTIKETIREISEREGYDLVILDESVGEIASSRSSSMKRTVQVRQQIINRSILYANPMLDITEDVITRMNNAYAQATAKPDVLAIPEANRP